MSISMLTEKQKERIESKKKKAEALITLLKDAANSAVLTSTSTPSSSTIHKKQGTIPGITVGIDNYRQLIQERCSHKMMAMERPKLYLCVDDLKDVPSDPQPLLYMSDLQRLLLYMIQGQRASIKPRWCRLLRVARLTHIVVVVIDSLSDLDLTEYSHCFTNIATAFKTSVEVVSSEQYGVPFTDEIFVVQQSASEIRAANKTLKSIDTVKTNGTENGEESLPNDMTRTTHHSPHNHTTPSGAPSEVVSHWYLDHFPRTHLLLTKAEMIQDRYPIPVHTKHDTYADFVFTRDQYITPTPRSPLFGIDCEMCLTSKRRSELTRITIVNEDMAVVYDTMVKPANKIIDYLTQFSGITKKLLDPVTTTLSEVQSVVRSILPDDAILVGHSLNNDLLAMKMFHPYIIDTSLIYNTKGEYGYKTSLRDLARMFLQRSIQNKKGHCSAEDATATLELALLKLQHDISFGDCLQDGRMIPSFEMHDNWYRDLLQKSTSNNDNNLPNPPITNTECNNATGDAQSNDVGPNNKETTESSNTTTTITKSPVEKRKQKSLSNKHCSKAKKLKSNGSVLQNGTIIHDIDKETDDKIGHTHSQLTNNDTDMLSSNMNGESNNSKHTKNNGLIKSANKPSCDIEDKCSKSIEPSECKNGMSDSINMTDNLANCSTNDGKTMGSRDRIWSTLQKCHFFKRTSEMRASHRGFTSLLNYVSKFNKSMSLINERSVSSEPSLASIQHIPTTSDRAARVEGVASAQTRDITWVRLHKYESLLSEGGHDVCSIESCLRKLDRQAMRIISAAPVHSGCVIVLPGRADGQHNGKLFLKTQVETAEV